VRANGAAVSVARPEERLRLQVIADFEEEGWPSMDTTAEMLAEGGARMAGVDCQLVRPALWRLSAVGRPPRAFERASGRFVQYPLALAVRAKRGHCFHIADHSYAHLGHLLPASRLGVYCHDTDAFRALAPGAASSLPRRVMARSILAGLRRASVVFHSTEVVREELISSGLLSPERLVHAPYGTAPEFSPHPSDADPAVRARLGGRFVLHVGSCIPRKNTGFLLRLLAHLRRELPGLCLLQVGGTWPAEQRSLLTELGLEGAVLQLRGLPRAELAAMYRQAELVLLPSRAEGFGLPLIEALACGAKVLCSDLPVFREVAAGAAQYAPLDELEAWAQAARALLAAPADPIRAASVRQAAHYSWHAHAERIIGAYRSLLRAELPGRA
jgi:glycosyltransferase involved in cell wall biosynthesis